METETSSAAVQRRWIDSGYRNRISSDDWWQEPMTASLRIRLLTSLPRLSRTRLAQRSSTFEDLRFRVGRLKLGTRLLARISGRSLHMVVRWCSKRRRFIGLCGELLAASGERNVLKVSWIARAHASALMPNRQSIMSTPVH